MSVGDHGLEAIRKSTVAINASEYQLRTIATTGLLAGISYDYFSVAYPTATQEVYTYKTGGAGGTTVATVTINYTDATKNYMTNATVS